MRDAKKPTDKQRIRRLEADVKNLLVQVGIQSRLIKHLQDDVSSMRIDPVSMT